MSTFPTALPSYSDPTSGNFLNNPSHATQHAANNDDTVAIATKIGTGASTPTANTFFQGNGTGTSIWSNLPVMSPWVTDTDAATITFDLSTGNKHVVTLGGNRTLALSNVLSGHVFIIKLIQDGSGSHTVTWFSTVTWRGTGGVTPTLSTAASAVDIFGFIQTSSGNYDGFIISQG